MKNWIDVNELGIDDVLRILPHRYPFLMVDRVLEIKISKPLKIGMSAEELVSNHKGSYTRAIKNVTFNEAQFQGHFPGNPIFPGVLTLEAMAQTAAFITVPFVAAANGGKLPPLAVMLAGIDGVRFRKPIRPGDQMEMRVEVKQTRGALWFFDGVVLVEGKKVAEGEFLAQLGVGELKS